MLEVQRSVFDVQSLKCSLYQPDLVNMLRVAQILFFIRSPAAIFANIPRILNQMPDLLEILLLCKSADVQRVIACADLFRHCPSLHEVYIA